MNGAYAGENLYCNGSTDTTVVMRGKGGADTLVLNATPQELVSVNDYVRFFGNIIGTVRHAGRRHRKRIGGGPASHRWRQCLCAH